MVCRRSMTRSPYGVWLLSWVCGFGGDAGWAGLGRGRVSVHRDEEVDQGSDMTAFRGPRHLSQVDRPSVSPAYVVGHICMSRDFVCIFLGIDSVVEPAAMKNGFVHIDSFLHASKQSPNLPDIRRPKLCVCASYQWHDRGCLAARKACTDSWSWSWRLHLVDRYRYVPTRYCTVATYSTLRPPAI